eukprot:5130987-Alexandrium_andersonii.AAC.1
MSASLVGSEMCIRDSEGGVRIAVRSARCGQVEAEEVGGLRMRDASAVSYTHLTLPTICSV